MVYSYDWTVTDNPADHSKFKDQPSFVRKIRTDIEERIADILYGFTTGETLSGFKKVLMQNQAADPSAPTDAVVLFAKDLHVFTVSGITTVPTAGATYTNNTQTFTVLFASATQIYATGTGAPAASGTLTKASGTGDSSITFSASSSKSEPFIRHESAGVNIFTSLGKIIAGAITSLETLTAAAGRIPIANLASGTPDGTKFIRDDGSLQNVPTAIDRIVQHVYTETAANTALAATIPADNTTPQNTEGVEIMTRSITPTNANNILCIEARITLGGGDNAQTWIAALFQDSNANALNVSYDLSGIPGGEARQLIMKHYMVAGTTSATTFKIRAGSGGGTAPYLNHYGASVKFNGLATSSMSITEIKV